MYPLATQARGARCIVVPAKDFGHDLDAMLAAIGADTRVVFIANPNNPTGTMLTAAALEAFLARVPRHVIVVLDEAYNEYLAPDLRCPSIAWLAKFPNLHRHAHVLQGLRPGRPARRLRRVPSRRSPTLLNRVRQPFNVNNLALAAAVAALDDQAFVDESYALNAAGMKQLTEAFKAHGPRSGFRRSRISSPSRSRARAASRAPARSTSSCCARA